MPAGAARQRFVLGRVVKYASFRRQPEFGSAPLAAHPPARTSAFRPPQVPTPLNPALPPNPPAGIQNCRRQMTPAPLHLRTSVHYADTRVKQPGRRQLSSALLWLPPPHRPAYDGHRGGKRLRFRVNPTGQPCPPTNQPTASRQHREKIRVAGPQKHGLTFVGTLSTAGPVSSPIHSTNRVPLPASGCHHRAVLDNPSVRRNRPCA